MVNRASGRPGFREWVDRQTDPGWGLMPLTHISKGMGAEDVIRTGSVRATECKVFEEPLAYFFYGRPAYRVGEEGVIKVEAACPFCFIFDATLIEKATFIHAFDTGAFERRLYSHTMADEMKVEDFSLETDNSRPNRIISAVFHSKDAYFDGDITKMVAPDQGAEAWEFHARAYLHLLASRGRNEPDDRICSIEVAFGEDVSLAGNLRAIIVPHTLWGSEKKAPWLEKLQQNGIEVSPYSFLPGRHPDYYHAQLEIAVREIYNRWEVL